jgi:hypothetical protein
VSVGAFDPDDPFTVDEPVSGGPNEERRRLYELALKRDPNVSLQGIADALQEVRSIVDPLTGLPTAQADVERRLQLIEQQMSDLVANTSWIVRHVQLALSALSAMPGMSKIMAAIQQQGGQHGGG